VTALIAVFTGDGCVGRCDAKCYHAWGPERHCVCRGGNHGAGKQEAIDTTREMAGSCLEQATPAFAAAVTRGGRRGPGAGPVSGMVTLISYQSSGGDQGRCDAKCYDAREPDCDCICGGRNHGAGREQATGNTRELAQSWVKRARANGQDVSHVELALTVMHEPLFDLATRGGTR
jgi:hypothetical protein